VDAALVLRALRARDDLVAGRLRCRALRDLILSVPTADRETFVDEVLGLPSPPPDEVLPRGAVPYLPCNVDDVIAALYAVPVSPHDRFVDLGAGLGRVAILAHLLTGARAHGVELQAPLVELARARAAALGLPAVTFAHADAAEAELAGTMFFLYAPFNGDLLRRVLVRLEAVERPFVIATVDLELHGAPWLRARPFTSSAVTIYDALAA
jgi:SAM-dependent methyltransferase